MTEEPLTENLIMFGSEVIIFRIVAIPVGRDYSVVTVLLQLLSQNGGISFDIMQSQVYQWDAVCDRFYS